VISYRDKVEQDYEMENDISILYKEYYKDLYGYIYMITLDSFDTEDVLHNVFLKAMKGLETFRGDSSLKTWLFTIARNECLNYMEKNKREVQTEDIDISIGVGNFEDKLVQRESVHRILQYIRSKEEPIRSLLILRLIEERSFVEIGRILGKTDVWCRINFFRTKKILIDLLENNEEAEGKRDEG
jgi:RNA polymerase sigma factor (sigma-70 family)